MKIKAILILIALAVAGYFLVNNNQEIIQDTEREEIHYHAGFQVYKDQQVVDLAKLEYMKIEPCGDDHSENIDAEHEQLEKAHLHDNVGDVVHVHREDATWADLFTNIDYQLPENAVAYDTNSQKINNFPSSPIKAYQSIIIFEDQAQYSESSLENAVQREYMIEVEQTSENCGQE